MLFPFILIRSKFARTNSILIDGNRPPKSRSRIVIGPYTIK